MGHWILGSTAMLSLHLRVSASKCLLVSCSEDVRCNTVVCYGARHGVARWPDQQRPGMPCWERNKGLCKDSGNGKRDWAGAPQDHAFPRLDPSAVLHPPAPVRTILSNHMSVWHCVTFNTLSSVLGPLLPGLPYTFPLIGGLLGNFGEYSPIACWVKRMGRYFLRFYMAEMFFCFIINSYWQFGWG